MFAPADDQEPNVRVAACHDGRHLDELWSALRCREVGEIADDQILGCEAEAGPDRVAVNDQ